MIERYVLTMEDEGSLSHYLIEDQELFLKFVNADDDEEIWALIDEHEEELGTPVYSLKEVMVIDDVTSSFY